MSIITDVAKAAFPETTQLITKTLNDIKRLKNLCKLFQIASFIVFGLLYQIYMMASGSNIWYAHLILMALSIFAFIHTLKYWNLEGNVTDNSLRAFLDNSKLKNDYRAKLENRIMVIDALKLCIRLFIVIISIYNLVENPQIFKTIFTTLLVAELLVESLIKWIVRVAERRFNDIVSAFNTDSENWKGNAKDYVVDRVSNFATGIGKKLFSRREKPLEDSDDYYTDKTEETV